MSDINKKVSLTVVIDNLKQLLAINKEKGMYTNAIFFAEKIVHLYNNKSDEYVDAVYQLGNILTSSMLHAEQRIPKSLPYH